MGCFHSKSNTLSHLDDSLKVMTSRDAKRSASKGQAPAGYVPRAPHPLLDGKNTQGGHSILAEEPADIFGKTSEQQN